MVVAVGNAIDAVVSEIPGSTVAVQLRAAESFGVQNSLPRLRIGDEESILSGFADNGDTRRIIFQLPESAYAKVPDGAEVTVRYGTTRVSKEWRFGKFKKLAPRRP